MPFPISLPPGFELEVHLPEGFELDENPASNEVKPPPGFHLEKPIQSSPPSGLGNAAGSAAGATSGGFFAPVAATAETEPAVSPKRSQARAPRTALRPTPSLLSTQPTQQDQDKQTVDFFTRGLARFASPQAKPATITPTPDRSAQSRDAAAVTQEYHRPDNAALSLPPEGLNAALAEPVTPTPEQARQIRRTLRSWQKNVQPVIERTMDWYNAVQPYYAIQDATPEQLGRMVSGQPDLAGPAVPRDPDQDQPVLVQQPGGGARYLRDQQGRLITHIPEGARRAAATTGIETFFHEPIESQEGTVMRGLERYAGAAGQAMETYKVWTGRYLVPSAYTGAGVPVGYRPIEVKPGQKPPQDAIPEMVYPESERRKLIEANAEMLRGIGEIGTPAAIAGSLLAPVQTYAGIGLGMLSSEAAGELAHGRVTPETEDLIRQIALLAPATFGTLTGLKTSVLETPEGVRIAAFRMFGGKVRGGVGESPTQYGAEIGIGGTKFGVRIPKGGKGRGSPEVPSEFPPSIEAKTQLRPSESVQTTVPGLRNSEEISSKSQPVTEQNPTRDAAALLQRYNDRVYPEPKPKTQVPAKPAAPDYLSPEKFRQFAANLAALPEMQRGDAMAQAHQQMTAWMTDRIGKPWMGPDHKLHIIRSPQEAEKLALEFINDQVDLHEQRLAEARTPFPNDVAHRAGHTQALPSAQSEVGAQHISPTPTENRSVPPMGRNIIMQDSPPVRGLQEIPKAPNQEPLAEKERLWKQPEKINPAALEQFTPENTITAPQQFSPGQQVLLPNGEPAKIETFIPNLNRVVVRTDAGLRTVRPGDIRPQTLMPASRKLSSPDFSSRDLNRFIGRAESRLGAPEAQRGEIVLMNFDGLHEVRNALKDHGFTGVTLPGELADDVIAKIRVRAEQTGREDLDLLADHLEQARSRYGVVPLALEGSDEAANISADIHERIHGGQMDMGGGLIENYGDPERDYAHPKTRLFFPWLEAHGYDVNDKVEAVLEISDLLLRKEQAEAGVSDQDADEWLAHHLNTLLEVHGPEPVEQFQRRIRRFLERRRRGR